MSRVERKEVEEALRLAKILAISGAILGAAIAVFILLALLH